MGAVWDSNEQFCIHEKLSLTRTLHVNCMKHDLMGLIYNSMLSKTLLIHITILSIWCVTSFTIRLAMNKCLRAYDFRHLFAGNLSLYRQGCNSAYSTAFKVTCILIRSGHPTASYAHSHAILQI